ncbi:peptidase C39 family protein [Streptomyces griseoviridis]|uniref:peptidase C39 family protein n=1 Tax=Streptomyces griseoviridis TaxID=45398 RepID=UPI00343BCE5C
MTSHRPTPVTGAGIGEDDGDGVVVAPFEPGEQDAALSRIAPAEVLERWRAADRSAHAPRIVAVPGNDGTDWTAAALVTARPGTAYLKIVDAVGDVPAAVEAVVAYAWGRGLAQVKWEGWTASTETAAAAGFTELSRPLGRAGEREREEGEGQDQRQAREGEGEGEPLAGPDTGHVLWLTEAPPSAPPPYYGQTTHFTCGAVTALVARAHAGALSRAEFDRQAELTLWREATNFPACEPVGLGVAVRRNWPSSPVTIHLDTDRPVLLDHLQENEREWRAVLQRASRADADRLGVPIDPGHLTIEAIRGTLERRDHVLLLISLAAMQGFEVPHWVACHGTVPGAIVIEDPWSNPKTGDTWVDAHLLPVPDESLDGMSRVGEEGVRGAVVVGRG